MNTLNRFGIPNPVSGMAAAALLAAFALPASALQLSLGIRETAAGGGAEVPIGGNAGASGGIEWVDLNSKTVLFDGLWHAYTWNLSTATFTAFAGATANNVLNGNYGSIESLRFRNNTGVSGPFTVWIDYVVNTVSSGPVVIQSFEGFADGTEVIFQEPSFSGSTSGSIAPGSSAGVDNSLAFDGTASYKVNWSFVDNTDRWLRLTTFNAANTPNPLIRFDQNSEVTVYMMAVVPEPTSAVMLLLGGAMLLIARRRRS
jgi:hypothetical protein